MNTQQSLPTIPGFQITAEIGRGGMATVYAGTVESSGEPVAIKVMNPTLGMDPNFRRRFLEECQLTKELQHKHIVPIPAFGCLDTLYYMVMAYLNGGTLADRLTRSISQDDAVRVLRQIADGLGYAHKRGIVHRDIKPTNVLFDAGGDAVLSDFGIAKAIQAARGLTRTGTVIGTPDYMSPEQCAGRPLDGRCDLYSLGVMLYEMLVGELPYKAEDPIAIALKHRDEPVPRLPSRMLQYQATIDRLLAKRMEDRFADAESLIAALDGKIPRADLSPTTIRDKKSDKSQPPDANRPNAKQGSSVDREAKFDPDTKQDGSRTGNSVRRSLIQSVSASPILMGISAAGVVLAVVVGVWLAIRGPSPERPQAMAVTGSDVPEVTTGTPMPGVTEISEPKSEFAAGATFLDCSGCPEMIAVAAGEYLQGSPDDESGRQKNEGPLHAVTISYPLGVGKYEVTRSQFAQFVTETKRPLDGCWSYAGDWKMRKSSSWQSPGFSQSEDHPATCLSWADAKDYAEWLTRKTGKPYRLLSSSEWEYIARAGNGLARNWGSNPGTACEWANVADQSAELSYPGWTTHPCTDRFVHTAPVDAYRPNDFGIYGTLGNVFEWVEDCYHDGYDGIPADGSAVTTSGCTEHILRGGSWFSRPEYVRSAFLNHFDKNMRSSTFGLRVARNLQPI